MIDDNNNKTFSASILKVQKWLTNTMKYKILKNAFLKRSVLSLFSSKQWRAICKVKRQSIPECGDWLFQTLEFSISAFPNFKNLDFSLFQTLKFLIFSFPHIGSLDILVSQTLEFSIIFRFSKLWKTRFWPFQTLEFSIFDYTDMGIFDFGFSNHWNSQFLLFQTLEFSIWEFPNTAIRDICFSKHWNSVFGDPNIGILNFCFSKRCYSVFVGFQKAEKLYFGLVFETIKF